MPLSVECDHCFHTHQNIPDSAIGKTFKCRSCGERVKVTPGGPAEAAPLPTQKAQPAKGRAKAKSKSPNKKESQAPLLVGVVAAIIVVVVAGGVFWSSTENSNNDATSPVAASTTSEEEIESLSDDDLQAKVSAAEAAYKAAPPRSQEFVEAHQHWAKLMKVWSGRDAAKASPVKMPSVSPQDLNAKLAAEEEQRLESFQNSIAAQFRSQDDGEFFVKLFETMNLEELRAAKKSLNQLRLLPTGGISVPMSGGLPLGWNLTSDETVMQRKDLLAKHLQSAEKFRHFASPIARIPLDEYRDLERAYVQPRVDQFRTSMKNTIASLSEVADTEILFGVDGFTFPETVRDAVDAAFATHTDKVAEQIRARSRNEKAKTIAEMRTENPAEESEATIVRRRDAIVQKLKSAPTEAYAAIIVSKMTAEQFAEFEPWAENFSSTINLSGMMSLVSLGYELEDEEFSKRKQAVLVKRFSEKEKLTAVASVLENLSVTEFSELESQIAQSQLERIRDAFMSPRTQFRLSSREDLSVGENGFQFPNNIAKRIAENVRRNFKNLNKKYLEE